MEVRLIPERAEYQKVQSLINSCSNLEKLAAAEGPGKSPDTISSEPVVETRNFNRYVDVYA